jgi:uncharacterized membrane protein YbhN (UPF0104 family)
MKLRIGPKVRVALQLGASVGLLAYLLSRLDWQESRALVGAANPLLLAAIVLVHILDRVLMALKWHQLLRVLDDRLERRSAIAVYYESTFVGFALPLGGIGPDIVRFLRLKGRGIDPHVTLSSIVMERLNGVIATLAFIVAGCIVLARLAPHQALRHFATGVAVVAGVMAVVGATLIFHPPFGRALVGLLKVPVSIEGGRFAKYVAAARAYSSRRLTLALNLGLSMIEQTAPVFTMWIASYALGAPLSWAVCLAVTPVAVIIQRLPLTYGGLGLREGSAAALLVAFGYDYSTALVLLMTQLVMFLISLLPGAIVLATSGRPLAKRASA